jgi:hypothetical protein
MTTTLELLSHPRIRHGQDGEGNSFIAYGMNGWGEDVTAEYWQVDRPTDLDPRQSFDRFRYRLPRINGAGGQTYSHPSETGCQIMILKHFIEIGLLAPAADNSHLDEKNAQIAADILEAWEARTGHPRVGDFVIMPDGAKRRCSHAWDDGMQTSDGGSYHISKNGRASMSGSLHGSRLWEYFKDTGETEPGRFWFFSHGISGAGRGVDFFLPCRVYRLEPFTMTEEEARAHPKAKRTAEFWGEGHRDHLAAVVKLMKGEA